MTNEVALKVLTGLLVFRVWWPVSDGGTRVVNVDQLRMVWTFTSDFDDGCIALM